jgi:hypothetical protein
MTDFVSRKQLVVLFAWFAAAGRMDAQIADNSFLIEEAYNQEPGVVQHINAFSRANGTGNWLYAFTQEWPVRVQQHQLSYTIPVAHSADQGGSRTGIGDVAVNYRYQLLGVGGGPAFAPRLSVLLPTGSSRRGFGAGGTTWQVNLPVSVTLPAGFVAHSNAGMSFTPHARNTADAVAVSREYFFGQSLIWLIRRDFNFMIEGLRTTAYEVVGPDRTAPTTEFLVSPGVRGAINFRSGLQIVPGLAVPIGVGPSRGERSLFVYLSFEHAFAKQAP